MPLYDAFGSTIEIVLLGNPQIVANYSYDPYGVRKVNSGYRSPFPFLFHGLEQEYYDSLKLYWEPNGNVYNPDPFQLSLSGPQGLGGGGGAFPRAIRGPGSNPQANIALDVYDATANVVALTGGIPICWNDSCGTFFLPGLDGLFGGDSKPTIPWYDTTHKSRGAHDVYCRVQGICGAIVTQRSNIVLAQWNEDEDEKKEEPEEGGPLGDIFQGKRPVLPSTGLLIPTDHGVVFIKLGSDLGPAENGRGYRFSTGKPGIELRVMGPRPEKPWNAPYGYLTWQKGPQAIDPRTGGTVSKDEAHWNIFP